MASNEVVSASADHGPDYVALESDNAILRGELLAATARAAQAAAKAGRLQRAVMDWIQQVNIELFDDLRQRMQLDHALISAIAHLQNQGVTLVAMTRDDLALYQRAKAMPTAAASTAQATVEALTQWLTATHPEQAEQVERGTLTLADAIIALVSPITAATTPTPTPQPAPPATVTIAAPVTAAPDAAGDASDASDVSDLSLNEWSIEILRIVGEGAHMDKVVFASLPPRLIAGMAASTVRRGFNRALASLVEAGLVVSEQLDLAVPTTVIPQLAGSRAMGLTAEGVRVFRQRYGRSPQTMTIVREGRSEQVSPLEWHRAIYRSLENAVLIDGVARAIETNAEAGGWRVRVVDFHTVSNAQLRKLGIPGVTRRAFPCKPEDPLNPRSAEPDLVVHMQPIRGGGPVTMLVEVERANYGEAALIDKFRRNIRAYPPLHFAYVTTSRRVAARLINVFVRQAVAAEEPAGLPRGMKAMFTDVAQVWAEPWRSIEQIAKLDRRQKLTTNGDVSSRDVLLPYYWEQGASASAFDRAHAAAHVEAATEG